MINTVILVAICILGVFLMMVVMSPEKTTQKKKSPEPNKDLQPKDWEALVLKLEKHIHSLRAEIESLKAQERKNLKELALEKDKSAQLQEKLSKEKEWLAKEEESLDKKDREMNELKQNLMKGENDFEREYSAKLRTEQQLKDLKVDQESLTKDNREQSLKIMRLESELDAYKKELSKLKKANEELSKKNDETQWVAKAQYDKLAQKLQEKEKEIERLSRDD